MTWSRWWWLGAGALLAPVLFAVGSVSEPSTPAPAAKPDPALAPVGAAEVAGDPTAVVTALQQRLERLPKDDGAWASLGQAYLAQARASADPSYYGRAAGAFEQSLAVRPDANAAAVTGQAALANAQHDFAAGRDLARHAVDIDPYDATAHGVLGDALIELGDYDGARAALQKMADLRPGVPALTRVSYLYELRGDYDDARDLLERALELAVSPAQAGFVLQYLGRLALLTGDYPAALAHVEEGLRRDPRNAELLAARGAVHAALGDTTAARADYDTAVQRLPQPSFVIEYAELLDSLAQPDRAAEQYAVAEAQRALFDGAGVTPDIEVALYEADHADAQRAVAIATEQIEQRPGSVVVADAMAWALHAAGRDAEALGFAVTAQGGGSPNALRAYHLGMIQRELGLTAEARESLQQALTASPEFSPLHAPLARRALVELDAG